MSPSAPSPAAVVGGRTGRFILPFSPSSSSSSAAASAPAARGSRPDESGLGSCAQPRRRGWPLGTALPVRARPQGERKKTQTVWLLLLFCFGWSSLEPGKQAGNEGAAAPQRGPAASPVERGERGEGEPEPSPARPGCGSRGSSRGHPAARPGTSLARFGGNHPPKGNHPLGRLLPSPERPWGRLRAGGCRCGRGADASGGTKRWVVPASG